MSRIDNTSGGGELGGTRFGQQPGEAAAGRKSGSADNSPIGRGVSGNAMSDTGPAQPDEESIEETNKDLRKDFEGEDDASDEPFAADKVGGINGPPD